MAILRKNFIAVVVSAALLGASSAMATVFSNPATITFSTTTPGGIPGVSSPYPSTINVAGVPGTITKITVTLSGISHDRPDDIEILLVGPTGAKYALMADAGGTTTAAAGLNLTFDDAAGSQLPDSGPLSSGTFQPTCVDFQNTINTDFPAPAPVGPYSVAAPRGAATLAATFNGTNPNGTWSLYVVDDIANPSPVNTIASGWSLDITGGASVATTTTLSAAPNPSFTTAPNNSVTFTATVRSNGVAVGAQGTVTFKEGAITLAGPTALNASGQASFSTTSLSEGAHTISAFYNGTASLNQSSGDTTQTVNNHTTTVSSNQFWNLGLISIPDTGSPSTPAVYPSQIFVSGLTGTISAVSVTLSNVTHLNPDDLKVLLVSPSGAKFVLLGNVGGATDIASTTLTLTDAAGSLLPDAGALVTGSYKPSFVASSAAVFPSPAPNTPYAQPAPAGAATLASAFSGSTPNGTWSLYVVDDIAGNGSGSIGAWGLTIDTAAAAATTTTLGSSVNPSLVGQSVTFTATVKKTSDNSPVTTGTVTFREGANVLAGSVALNGSGAATFNTSALTEGQHVISADYNGSPGTFAISSGSVTQTVDGVTVVNGTMFGNPGAVQIVSGATPSVYPSRIHVTGLPPSFCRMSVTVSNLSIDVPDDVELLLVSPSGAKFVLLSDAGGFGLANNITLEFSDIASGLIPDSGPLTSGNFQPTDVSSTPASFPAPAPGSPYQHPAPTGVATLSSTFAGNPNGYWSLYVVDDVLGGQPLTIAGGWWLNFIYAPVAVVGGPQDVLSGGSSTGLGGNVPPSGATGSWTVVGGGTGTFSPDANTPNAIFNHTGGSGPITVRWTLTDPACGSSSADVVLTVVDSVSIVVNAVDTGWYTGGGSHSPGNANYYVGNDGFDYYRNWFVFNIPTLSAPVSRAELRVNSYRIDAPSGSEIYQLHEVTTPVPTLTAGGSGLTGIYADLGDGPVYAARAFAPFETNRFITIPLNAAARAAVMSVSGSSFAIGGEIATLDGEVNTTEDVFSFSLGLPGDAQLLLTLGTGAPPVGYFTDGNPASTGPQASILSAGFTPLHISDISTQNLAGLRILLINESDNNIVSATLSNRLADIRDWVVAGGRLMVHDRSAGILTPNPFLLGTPGTGTIRLTTADLDVIDPATTLVTAGPFGILNNTSLDGGNSSAHGYVTAAALPPQTRSVISMGANAAQVVSFCYPLGAGFVYYSSIPLDCYLSGNPCDDNTIAPTVQATYLPNALVYLHTLNAPLRFQTPVLTGSNDLTLWLESADQTPVSPDRAPRISLQSASTLTAPILWTPLNNPKTAVGGLLRIEGLKATNFPTTFFRAIESP